MIKRRGIIISGIIGIILLLTSGFLIFNPGAINGSINGGITGKADFTISVPSFDGCEESCDECFDDLGKEDCCASGPECSDCPACYGECYDELGECTDAIGIDECCEGYPQLFSECDECKNVAEPIVYWSYSGDNWITDMAASGSSLAVLDYFSDSLYKLNRTGSLEWEKPGIFGEKVAIGDINTDGKYEVIANYEDGFCSGEASCENLCGSDTGCCSNYESCSFNGCSGIPFSCDSYGPDQCESAGCSFNSYCSGQASCEGLDEGSCGLYSGCSWDVEQQICIGSYDCSENGCIGDGCNWIEECNGEPYSCDSYSEQPSCDTSGCSWAGTCTGEISCGNYGNYDCPMGCYQDSGNGIIAFDEYGGYLWNYHINCDYISDIELRDLNGDGWKETVASDTCAGGTITALDGYGNPIWSENYPAIDIAASDLDNDGWPDIATINWGLNTMSAQSDFKSGFKQNKISIANKNTSATSWKSNYRTNHTIRAFYGGYSGSGQMWQIENSGVAIEIGNIDNDSSNEIIAEGSGICIQNSVDCSQYNLDVCLNHNECELNNSEILSCSGTPEEGSCINLDYNKCGSVEGCAWAGSYCDGYVTQSCDSLSLGTCPNVIGCYLDSPNSQCAGNMICSNFNFYEDRCGQAGCSWDPICMNYTFDCSEFNHNEQNCSALSAYCTWNQDDSTCSGTVYCSNFNNTECDYWGIYCIWATRCLSTGSESCSNFNENHTTCLMARCNWNIESACVDKQADCSSYSDSDSCYNVGEDLCSWSEDHGIYAYKNDGTLNWTYITGDDFAADFALGDTDHDNQDEIAALTVGQESSEWNLLLLDGNGTLLWEKTIGESEYTISDSDIYKDYNLVKIEDIDGDGHKEIIAGTPEGKVYAYDRNGNLSWIFNAQEEICQSGNYCYGYSPDYCGSWEEGECEDSCCGDNSITDIETLDVNHDGIKEVVASARNKIYAFGNNTDDTVPYSLSAPNVTDSIFNPDEWNDSRVKSFYFVPTSDHPPGNIYTYEKYDNNYVYFAADVTPDNTEDNEDIFGVALDINNNGFWCGFNEENDGGWTVYGDNSLVTYCNAGQHIGSSGFGMTPNVNYSHRYFEMAIPIAGLGNYSHPMGKVFFGYGTLSPWSIPWLNPSYPPDWNSPGSNLSYGFDASGFTDLYLGYIDSDNDGLLDNVDNCPYVYNPGQEDTDIGPVISQWASNATGSSAYGDNQNPGCSECWGFADALGEPNTESCNDLDTAWSPDGYNEEDWIELDYTKNVYATGVNIHETYQPNGPFIIKVDLIDTNNESHTVWENEDTTECPGWLNITFEQTDYLVRAVNITVYSNYGYSEIDAVQLIGIKQGDGIGDACDKSVFNETIEVPPIMENESGSSGIIDLAEKGVPANIIENTGVTGYEYTVTTNGSTSAVNISVEVFIEPPTNVTDISNVSGAVSGFYYKIEVNDSAWYENITSVQLKIYYNLSNLNLSSEVSESSLRPVRYTNGSWIRLDCPDLGGCPAALSDGTSLYSSGTDIIGKYVWANLSRFSVYGIGGYVTPQAPASAAGGNAYIGGSKMAPSLPAPPAENITVCGDNICEINESSENCCSDCGCRENEECRDNACLSKQIEVVEKVAPPEITQIAATALITLIAVIVTIIILISAPIALRKKKKRAERITEFIDSRLKTAADLVKDKMIGDASEKYNNIKNYYNENYRLLPLNKRERIHSEIMRLYEKLKSERDLFKAKMEIESRKIAEKREIYQERKSGKRSKRKRR